MNEVVVVEKLGGKDGRWVYGVMLGIAVEDDQGVNSSRKAPVEKLLPLPHGWGQCSQTLTS